MRRLALLLAAVGVLRSPGAAGAHPLGNFSVNHIVRVRADAGELNLRYVLDQAEIPTFQSAGSRALRSSPASSTRSAGGSRRRRRAGRSRSVCSRARA